jgi:hypothetical protein
MLGRAVGVTYRALPEIPGAAFFDCDRLHAGLTTTACAGMWRGANEARSGEAAFDRYAKCRGCAVGATHAGVANASESPIRGAKVCARCGRGATRLIWDHSCVSCYNREREQERGYNARGVPPTKLKPLVPRRLFFRTNGVAQEIRRDMTAHPAELVLATLRDALHTVVFGWRGPTHGLRQLRLF